MNEDRFPPTVPRPVPPTEPIAGAAGPEPPAGLRKFIDRRKALALLAGGGAAALFAATRRSGGTDVSTDADPTGTTAADATATTDAGGGIGSTGQGAATTTKPAATAPTAGVSSPGRIPEETAGPYPADGTNGPNVLTQSGVVHSDIRRSFASGNATADGVPLTIELTLVDADSGKALPGAAVYLWHCDRLGRYSLYSPASVTRTTSGACRWPTPRECCVSPASSRGRTPAAGPTSTSTSSTR